MECGPRNAPGGLHHGAIGLTALLANTASFGLLWAYRAGDANMRSAWICTRNDVLGNLAVLLAAAGVFGTGTGWPDIIVAATMAVLAMQGATAVVGQSVAELNLSRILSLSNKKPTDLGRANDAAEQSTSLMAGSVAQRNQSGPEAAAKSENCAAPVLGTPRP